MKSCVLFVLLFGITISLFAQAAVNIPLYVPPVEDIDDGTATEDEAYDLFEDAIIFTDLLTRELEAWNFTLTATQAEADYTLVSTVSLVGTGPDGEALEDGEEKFELTLALQDKEGTTLYEQNLRYDSIEDVHSYIQTLLLNMFANVFVIYVAEIPLDEEEEIDPDLWRKKFSYMGGSFFWSPRIYHGQFLSSHLANFGFGLSAEFQFIRFATGNGEFLKYLSVSSGFEFVPDWVVATITPKAEDEWRNTIMQIPLRFHFVWRAGNLFMHQPYLGIHFNIPFYKDTTPAIASWEAGFQFGLKAGPGIAFADLRYSMDFGKSGLNTSPSHNDKRTYDRFVIHLGIGYKYDLVGMIQEIIRNRPPKGEPAKARQAPPPPPPPPPPPEEPELPEEEPPLDEELDDFDLE